MKKKIILLTILVFSLIGLFIGGFSFYHYWRIQHAIIKVTLKNDLMLEVYSQVQLKDLIVDINGKIEKNFKIDTSHLGKKTIEFHYTNEENIKVPYSFQVEIVDKTPPIISLYNNYYVEIGESVDLAKAFFCGDNYDDHPTCVVEGDYDLYQVGTYPLVYKATDESGNVKSHNFTLNVHEKTSGGNAGGGSSSYTDFQEIVAQHKNPNTKIGIDVSKWQGEIDFETLKKEGVEFAFIRVGRQTEIGGDYLLDEQFKRNIEGFNQVGIPVGVYFYTYANSKKEAIKQAKWTLKQIKNYQVSLPVVFDWENWSMYQDFGLSFYHLTEMAQSFMETVQHKGYQGMLYSSKNYLENVWQKTNYPVWLAHYTKQTNYLGDYQVWQLCNDGRVEGIQDSYVDIDVLYTKK